MASDGCQPLMPGVPGGPPLTGYVKKEGHSNPPPLQPPSGERYAAGVWYGPAPKGWRTPGDAAVPTETPFDPAKEPRSVLLPGGLRLPLLGVAAVDANSVSVGLRLGSLLVSPGHEAAVGDALKAAKYTREELFVAAVLPGAPTDAAGVQAAHAQLLALLGVSHLDLCVLDVSAAAQGATDPWPASVAAAWEALCRIAAADSVRAVGVAHAGWRTLDAMLATGVTKPAVNLCELHPLLPQRKLCGFAQRKGISMAALYPLAKGDPALMQHPTVTRLAQTYGKTPAQILVRYNVQRGVAVFSKSGLSDDELSGAFAFRFSYADKVLLDDLGAGPGRRFLAPLPGCRFAEDD